MPVKRIPLVGGTNYRSGGSAFNFSALGAQQFYECVFDVFPNEITRLNTIYVGARDSYGQSSVPNGVTGGTAILPWTGKGTNVVTAFGATNSTIYNDSSSLGAITGRATFISETLISGTPNIVIISASGSGRTWFYPDAGALTEITDTDFPPKQANRHTDYC